jgi:uncharacterized membrane protein
MTMDQHEPWKPSVSEPQSATPMEAQYQMAMLERFRSVEAQHALFVLAVDSYARFERRDRVAIVTRMLFTGVLAIVAGFTLMNSTDSSRTQAGLIVLAFITVHWASETMMLLHQRQYLMWARQRRDTEPQPMQVSDFYAKSL